MSHGKKYTIDHSEVLEKWNELKIILVGVACRKLERRSLVPSKEFLGIPRVPTNFTRNKEFPWQEYEGI